SRTCSSSTPSGSTVQSSARPAPPVSSTPTSRSRMANRRPPDRTARAAPQEPKRPWLLISGGRAAAHGIALVTLPAQVLTGELKRLGLESVALTGNVWSGHAQGLSWRSTPLGVLRWSLAPGELLRGRVGADLLLARPDGSASAHVSVSFGGDLRL